MELDIKVESVIEHRGKDVPKDFYLSSLGIRKDIV